MMNNYILAVAKYGNVSKAAEALGISQPALSAHIKKIEDQLDIVIFDRTVKPMAITDAGRLYIDYITQKNNMDRAFQEQLSDLNDLRRGKLILGGASFFNVSYYPKVIAAFAEKYPGIEIKVVDGSVPEVARMATDHKLDLFIAPSWDMEEACQYEKVATEKIFLCVPEQFAVNEELKDYRVPSAVVKNGELDKWIAEHGSKARPDFTKFEGEKFIWLEENQHIGNILAELFRRYGMKPDKSISVTQTMTSFGLTLSGAGISLITEGSLKTGIHESPALYLIDEDLGQRDMYIAYPRNKYLSGAAKEFIKIFKETI
jgi:DNA-binding transcriptional LysR family regulator